VTRHEGLLCFGCGGLCHGPQHKSLPDPNPANRLLFRAETITYTTPVELPFQPHALVVHDPGIAVVQQVLIGIHQEHTVRDVPAMMFEDSRTFPELVAAAERGELLQSLSGFLAPMRIILPGVLASVVVHKPSMQDIGLVGVYLQ
jgi:hypothetical protein